MAVEKIEKLEELLHLDKNKTIVGCKIERLTAPGENYGSLMLSVDITVKAQNGYEEVIHVVAKMVPPNKFIQEVFNTPVTFPNEVGFYKIIVPTLQQFQRECGLDKIIDFSPKYYGSRLNLNGSKEVDSDAVLLLENLKILNFVNLERTEGFNLEISKLVIVDLAHLHAVPLALKLRKPQVFEEKIKPYLSPFIEKEDVHDDIKEKLIKLVNSLDECIPYLERIYKALDIYPYNGTPREPFATVTHNDCWVNNTMVQLENNKPMKNKLVDFQICDYGSPAKDVLFFLFSSVQNDVLERYYADLIALYYNTFISILSDLKCEVSDFSFDNFQKELDFEAKNSQFFHIAVMLFPIFAPKGSVKEITELSPDDFGTTEPTDLHKEKLIFVIREFAKRKWI